MRQPQDRKLLVLDLDETLIYASTRPLPQGAGCMIGPYFVYKRPHVDTFITGCFEIFDVAVWTSSSPAYAAGVVGALFPRPPAFIWASDRCTLQIDWETREQCHLKKLAKLKRHGYDLARVITVDDSPEKHAQNYGNLVRVIPWTGDPEDDELPKLLRYLRTLRDVEDVRRVEKRLWRIQAAAST
jgi:RNA polymerase II subunit A small phosphatase-like protein